MHQRIKRPPFVFWSCLWLSGLAVVGVLYALDLLDPRPEYIHGRDFTNLYVAGRLVLEGRALDAFDVETFRLAIERMLGTATYQNYSYPPHALFVAVPFALLPYTASWWVWTLSGAAFFYWAVKRTVAIPPLLAILTPAAAVNVWAGHYGFFLGGLWLLFFNDLGKSKAGWIAASLTIKPHMGLFVAVAALNQRRTLLWAVSGTLALVALSAAIFAPQAWVAFFDQTTKQQIAVLTAHENAGYFYMMPSAYTAFGRNGLSLVMQAFFSIAAVVILWRGERNVFTYATATFIVLPYVFTYDMTVACLGFAFTLHQRWGSLGMAERSILTAAFLVPDIALFFPPATPPVLLAALWVQCRTQPSIGSLLPKRE